MKVLVTGAGGLLGRALRATVPAGVVATALARDALDVSDPAALARALAAHAPDAVINAAAYTAVDRAESEPERADAVNHRAVAALAAACAAGGARLLHVSTDFVFDGARGTPYRPDDAPNPLGAYGASKLAGERALAAQPGLDWLVLRTAWVHAADGQGFVQAILKALREQGRAEVVVDQLGNPTAARSLAGALWRALAVPSVRGLHHFTDAGVASRYDWACAIAEEGARLGLLPASARVLPVASASRPAPPARRPPCGVLDSLASCAALGIERRHWRAGLVETMEGIARG